MFAIRYTGPWHYDDIAYLRYLFDGLPINLLLGRPGFMFPLIWLWHILRDVFGAQFYFMEATIRMANISFLAFSYVLLFRILVAVQVPLRTAFLTVLFILSEFSFSVVSSRVTDTPMMFVFVFSSYLFFMAAHEQQKPRYLTISALLFAYSILVREPAVFYFPFFLVMMVSYYRKNKLFTLKKYIKDGLLFLAPLITAPALLLLFFTDIYIANFKISSPTYYFTTVGLIHKFQIIWETQFNHITLPIALLGLAIFLKTQGWRRFLAFGVAAPFSILLFIFFAENELVEEARLFLGLFCFLSLGLAIFINYVTDKIPQTLFRRTVLCIACAIAMYISYIRFVPKYEDDLREMVRQEKYYERIKPVLTSPNSILILGDESTYVHYRTQADNIECFLIYPGMYWPTGRLVTWIKSLLAKNLVVIYDPEGRKAHRKKREPDLNEMAETFKLTPIENGFIQVSLKN